MKQNLQICALMLLFACIVFPSLGQKASHIPAILQNHNDRSAFTLLGKKSNKPIRLFNGKDFTNFYLFDEDNGKNNDVDHCFNVENGMMHFLGNHTGYACTERSFKNYYLKVLVKWGEKKFTAENKARDAGVLYHFAASEKDAVWPKCIECQVKEKDFGDCWFLMGAMGKCENKTIHINDNLTRVLHSADYEKPHGEWNTIEIICYDNKSEHYVNGYKVNEATHLNVNEGRIILQSEGAEVYYKDIILLPLK